MNNTTENNITTIFCQEYVIPVATQLRKQKIKNEYYTARALSFEIL